MEQYWLDASFRGAPFFVESVGQSGGRRGPDHEFPQKDEGYPEDTGGKIGKHEIEGYVAQSIDDPDYAARRDALIAALNQRGPGELVHPDYGTIRVQVREWTKKEERSRLGMAVFSMSFVVASEATYPTATRNASARMPGLGSTAHAAAGGVFSRTFSVSGRNDFLLNSAMSSFGRIGNLFSLIGSLSGVSVNSSGLLAKLFALLATAAGNGRYDLLADAVAAFPRAITGQFEERHKATRNADGTYRGVASLRGNGPLEPLAVTSLYRAFSHEPEIAEPIRNTATRKTQHENAAAIATLVRQSTAIEAARVAPFVNWQTLQDAETARDKIADALEREAWATSDDELYVTLTDMRTLVLSTVAPDNGRLPLLMDYTPRVTMPSLALSHRLYGTAGKADELASINGLRHPGFIPGGEAIRILANA